MGKIYTYDQNGLVSVVDPLTLPQAKAEAIATMNMMANQELEALMPFLTIAKWLCNYINNAAKNALIAQMTPILSNLDTKVTAINACTTNDQVYAITWQ